MNAVPWLHEQIEYMRDRGFITTIFKIPNASIMKKLIAIIDLRKLIRTSKFTLIHCHWGYNTIFAYNSKIPIITTFHGSDLQGDVNYNGSITFKGKILIGLSKIGALLSTNNIYVSKRLERLKPKINLNKNFFIIPMGYNSKLFRPLDRKRAKEVLCLNIRKKYILFAGNYSQPVKGYSLAMETMNYLDASYELIKLDYAKYSDMPKYMNASNVLLMTSYQEGAPVIIKEALACNLTVVSTDVGDVKEITKDVPGCFIAKSRDPKKIAELIKKSISIDLTSVESIKIKKYSANKMNNKLKGLYLEKLDTK